MVVSSLEDLPAQATVERGTLLELGIKDGMRMPPILESHRPVGAGRARSARRRFSSSGRRGIRPSRSPRALRFRAEGRSKRW
jgi:hypothetical protein